MVAMSKIVSPLLIPRQIMYPFSITSPSPPSPTSSLSSALPSTPSPSANRCLLTPLNATCSALEAVWERYLPSAGRVFVKARITGENTPLELERNWLRQNYLKVGKHEQPIIDEAILAFLGERKVTDVQVNSTLVCGSMTLTESGNVVYYRTAANKVDIDSILVTSKDGKALAQMPLSPAGERRAPETCDERLCDLVRATDFFGFRP